MVLLYHHVNHLFGNDNVIICSPARQKCPLAFRNNLQNKGRILSMKIFDRILYWTLQRLIVPKSPIRVAFSCLATSTIVLSFTWRSSYYFGRSCEQSTLSREVLFGGFGPSKIRRRSQVPWNSPKYPFLLFFSFIYYRTMIGLLQLISGHRSWP